MDEAESYLFGLFEKVRCLRETHILEECVQGEPLSRRIETEHYLTEREARRCLLALADGLAVLHAHRILHRDIKPENLIEERDGTIRLIDFDAARVMGAEGEEKAADTIYLGTRGYAPPEQYGYGATDARSDIYALGMTMQELLGPDYHGSLARICRRASEDFHAYFDSRKQDTKVIRKVRDTVNLLKSGFVLKNVILVLPRLVLPQELQKDITIIDFDLPHEYAALQEQTIVEHVVTENARIIFIFRESRSRCRARHQRCHPGQFLRSANGVSGNREISAVRRGCRRACACGHRA